MNEKKTFLYVFESRIRLHDCRPIIQVLLGLANAGTISRMPNRGSLLPATGDNQRDADLSFSDAVDCDSALLEHHMHDFHPMEQLEEEEVYVDVEDEDGAGTETVGIGQVRATCFAARTACAIAVVRMELKVASVIVTIANYGGWRDNSVFASGTPHRNVI